uniref:Uncharacterized protein n=1 Tax=Cacopsylla melanoneura TaxID=428564 RepID=A0A8D8R8P7_9HEMI
MELNLNFGNRDVNMLIKMDKIMELFKGRTQNESLFSGYILHSFQQKMKVQNCQTHYLFPLFSIGNIALIEKKINKRRKNHLFSSSFSSLFRNLMIHFPM